MTAEASASTPATARLFSGLAGLLVVASASWGLRAPLASMASYTAALMALNQLAPPLLLLALPRVALGARGGLLAYALDPWSASLVFVGVSIAISLPGVFDPALANALYAAPLGVVELLSGLLFWAQLMPATRSIGPDWLVALLAWVGAMPMTAVAVIWMLSPNVLYTPYLDVICRWNIPPLADQQWAGLVMFVAGAPLPLFGAWILLGLSGRRRH
jgi:putative membrane protein